MAFAISQRSKLHKEQCSKLPEGIVAGCSTVKDFPHDVVLCVLILQLPYIAGKFGAVLGLDESSVL